MATAAVLLICGLVITVTCSSPPESRRITISGTSPSYTSENTDFLSQEPINTLCKMCTPVFPFTQSSIFHQKSVDKQAHQSPVKDNFLALVFATSTSQKGVLNLYGNEKQSNLKNIAILTMGLDSEKDPITTPVAVESDSDESAHISTTKEHSISPTITILPSPLLDVKNATVQMQETPIPFVEEVIPLHPSEMHKTYSPCTPQTITTLSNSSRVLTWTYNYASCVQEYKWVFVFPQLSLCTIEFHYVNIRFKDILEVISVYHGNYAKLKIFNESNQESLEPVLAPANAIMLRVFTSIRTVYLSESSSFNISFATQLHNSKLTIKMIKSIEPRDSYITYDCTSLSPIPQAIRCDGIRHCEQGEDEHGCYYTQEGCGDWFPYNDHCIKAQFITLQHYKCGRPIGTAPIVAEDRCSKLDAFLAKLPDQKGITIAAKLIRKSGGLNAAIGIRKYKPFSLKTRSLYRFLWQWGELGSSIAYEQQLLQRSGAMDDCGVLIISPKPVIKPISCEYPQFKINGYICMRPKRNLTYEIKKPHVINFPRSSQLPDQFPTKECPDGSVVQIFHQCPWGKESGDLSVGWSPGQLPLFQCRLGPPVHYSLVCDGNDDCADRSDETGCHKPQFAPLFDSTFSCRRNSQTIPVKKRCDGIFDCSDDSDEEYCTSCYGMYLCKGAGCVPDYYTFILDKCPITNPNPKFIPSSYTSGSVELDGFGLSILNPVVGTCTEGFYECLNGLCIPSFLINNGEKDCLRGEDENIPTNNITCPGYYRCKGVGNCVHRKYLCDGIYHCPDKDDEMFCHMTCPRDQGCVCEGHAFTCSQMINPKGHLQVRYLDLSHASNVSLKDIHVMEYLFFLNLSFCNLNDIQLKSMRHIQTLDISFNSVRELTSIFLHNLPGLLHLILSNNPLGKFLSTMTLNNSRHIYSINNIFDRKDSTRGRLILKTLELNNVSLDKIPKKWFSSLAELQYLDLRNNPIYSFYRESLWGLKALELLFTDQPKLCCSDFHFSQMHCYAPADELSSCNDLLGQVFFRVCLWTISVLSILGNVGVLVYRVLTETRNSFQASGPLLKHLCVADFLMGVYLMMIGIADIQFQGNYVAKEAEWLKSIACKVAGCLSFISSEVSAFLLCIITLDRVLVICLPFKKTVHLGSRITFSLCCLIWLTVIALAVIPLVSDMEFYGLNGICLPLPITRQPYSGQWYAFSIFIVVNFAIFFFILVGQLLIYRAVRKTRIASGGTDQDKDMTLARRLLLITCTDFCCWCPVVVMGMLAFHGIPIPGQLNVWTLIFVLPLNSALNPFLYTLNGLLEQQRKRRMKEREQRILGKLQSEIPKWQPSTVVRVTKLCIMSKKIDRDVIIDFIQKNLECNSVGQQTSSSVASIS